MNTNKFKQSMDVQSVIDSECSKNVNAKSDLTPDCPFLRIVLFIKNKYGTTIL